MYVEPDPKVVAEQERQKQAMLARARARKSDLDKGEPLVIEKRTNDDLHHSDISKLWLVCELLSTDCPKLPLRLERCATCGHHFEVQKTWTWIEPGFLFGAEACEGTEYWNRRKAGCSGCPMGPAVPRQAGLVWVSPEDLQAEEIVLPIPSMPDPAIEPGFTWCFVAVRDGDVREIHSALMVRRVDYILGHFEGENYYGDMLVRDELKQLVKQGITPVIIDEIPKGGGPKAAREDGS